MKLTKKEKIKFLQFVAKVTREVDEDEMVDIFDNLMTPALRSTIERVVQKKVRETERELKRITRARKTLERACNYLDEKLETISL